MNYHKCHIDGHEVIALYGHGCAIDRSILGSGAIEHNSWYIHRIPIKCNKRLIAFNCDFLPILTPTNLNNCSSLVVLWNGLQGIRNSCKISESILRHPYQPQPVLGRGQKLIQNNAWNPFGVIGFSIIKVIDVLSNPCFYF